MEPGHKRRKITSGSQCPKSTADAHFETMRNLVRNSSGKDVSRLVSSVDLSIAEDIRAGVSSWAIRLKQGIVLL